MVFTFFEGNVLLLSFSFVRKEYERSFLHSPQIKWLFYPFVFRKQCTSSGPSELEMNHQIGGAIILRSVLQLFIRV